MSENTSDIDHLKRFLKHFGISAAIFILVVAFLNFKFNFNWVVWNYLDRISGTEDRLRLFGNLFTVLFTIPFAIMGYRQAKKKHRNKIGWLLICMATNFWGWLALRYLPPLRDDHRN